MSEKVYIVGAKRTPIGAFGGRLAGIPAAHLGAAALKGALEQSGLGREDVDETVMGNILTAGQGMGPARQASIYAGIPEEKPAYAVNMLCASGMKALMNGAAAIRSGDAEVVASGGMENMSSAPWLLPSQARTGMRPGNQTLQDHMILDGLTDVFNDYHMGITAENIAEKYNLSREEQDRFALASQKKTAVAMAENRFGEEIVAVTAKIRRKEVVVDRDEFPRPETTLESLGKLRPAFRSDGTVTAGNSSGINDGGSALILAGETTVREKGLTPLAEIVSWAQAGLDPAYMGLGPVPAVRRVLEKAGLALTDMELLELNEAFAAQSLGVLRGLREEHGVSPEWLNERVNVNGGAIALGHPIGASGSRIIVTLLYEMMRRSSRLGLASLCVGGGMGTAVILKKV